MPYPPHGGWRSFANRARLGVIGRALGFRREPTTSNLTSSGADYAKLRHF
jgi:hypothetical protein